MTEQGARIRTDWAGPQVRIAADAEHMTCEFEISVAEAENLIASLRRSISGAESWRAER